MIINYVHIIYCKVKMKFISILLLALVLIGCETYSSNRIWYREGGTQDELAKDRYFCLLNSQQKVYDAQGVSVHAPGLNS